MQILKLEPGRFEFALVITIRTFLNCIDNRVGVYTYVCRWGHCTLSLEKSLTSFNYTLRKHFW